MPNGEGSIFSANFFLRYGSQGNRAEAIFSFETLEKSFIYGKFDTLRPLESPSISFTKIERFHIKNI